MLYNEFNELELYQFFAMINVISSGLQFGILPSLMSRIEPSLLWKTMPILMIGLTSFQSLQKYPSLNIVAISFLTMKVLEFSARRMLDEMVCFIPVSFLYITRISELSRLFLT